ncbi:hypothetical protein [Xanthomonas oryzae]|uniref:hypothetical protein n=1 Tax=Xanthomonas oryzae TaxID=347 RepID=UPI001058E340|nr:hypothetical protein [Xanthomonas oryzae]
MSLFERMERAHFAGVFAQGQQSSDDQADDCAEKKPERGSWLAPAGGSVRRGADRFPQSSGVGTQLAASQIQYPPGKRIAPTTAGSRRSGIAARAQLRDLRIQDAKPFRAAQAHRLRGQDAPRRLRRCQIRMSSSSGSKAL